MMTRTILLFGIFISCCCASYSQDSLCVIHKNKLLRYRRGYIITVRDDTLRGLIYHESDTGIMFIRAGLKIRTTVFGGLSKIPYIPAADNIVRAFYRNGIRYERCRIPPDGQFVYLAVLENGPLKLYAAISNYSDKAQADAMASEMLLGSLISALIAASNDKNKTDEEYYSMGPYYIQKGTSPDLVKIPAGQKKFENAFFPLVRDNSGFVKEMRYLPVGYYNLRSLVKQYNAMPVR